MKNLHFIDSHSHLFLDAFDKDLKQIIQNATKQQVTKICLPNIDSGSIQRLLDVCNQYKDICYPMMGLHPTSVKDNFEQELSIIKEELYNNNYIAVGEIGIDLYWDKTFIKEQKHAFRKQIDWAKDLDLPIVIHARNSFNEIFEIMDEVNDDHLSGVFHSFTGNNFQLEKILSYGFYIGINGIVTFKNSSLSEVVKNIPREKLLIETDSPFLAPVPHRGKRNESSYVVLVAEAIAKAQRCSIQEIAEQTTINTIKLFDLEK